jgi:predicted NAD/FAD-dependent oxidoreductase
VGVCAPVDSVDTMCIITRAAKMHASEESQWNFKKKNSVERSLRKTKVVLHFPVPFTTAVLTVVLQNKRGSAFEFEQMTTKERS